MTEVFLLSKQRMKRISPFFPLPHGIPRVDDRRVVSGIVYVIRNGLQWKDAPKEYGPHKTLYNRFIRWSEMGVFDRIFEALAAEGPPDCRQSAKKGDVLRLIGRTKGGLNSKLHAVCDEDGMPVVLALTEGQVSDFTGADRILDDLPKAEVLIGDKGYDSDKLREALRERGIAPCIPGRSNRKEPVKYDKELYKQRNLHRSNFRLLSQSMSPDPNGMLVPEELALREDRLARIAEAMRPRGPGTGAPCAREEDQRDRAQAGRSSTATARARTASEGSGQPD